MLQLVVQAGLEQGVRRHRLRGWEVARGQGLGPRPAWRTRVWVGGGRWARDGNLGWPAIIPRGAAPSPGLRPGTATPAQLRLVSFIFAREFPLSLVSLVTETFIPGNAGWMLP